MERLRVDKVSSVGPAAWAVCKRRLYGAARAARKPHEFADLFGFDARMRAGVFRTAAREFCRDGLT